MCKFTNGCKLRVATTEYDIVELACIGCGQKVYTSVSDMTNENQSIIIESIPKIVIENKAMQSSRRLRYGHT